MLDDRFECAMSLKLDPNVVCSWFDFRLYDPCPSILRYWAYSSGTELDNGPRTASDSRRECHGLTVFARVQSQNQSIILQCDTLDIRETLFEDSGVIGDSDPSFPAVRLLPEIVNQSDSFSL